jgi:hypothetical protein
MPQVIRSRDLRLPGATIEWISPLWRNQRFDIADDLIVIDQIATPRGQGPRPTFVDASFDRNISRYRRNLHQPKL